MKKLFIIPLLAAMLCGCFKTAEDNDKFTVYTSFYGMYDFAKMIAGDRAEIKELIPSGVEAHDWEPGTGDMIALSEADVFIYSGMDMEPWAESILESVDNEELTVIEASKGIKGLENGKATDPHVWLNPNNALTELENITEGLALADSENAEYYRNNFNEVKNKITELDQNFIEMAESIEDKEIIVTHGAFGYLCDAYGFKQYTIEGLSGESDPSSAAVRDVIDYMKTNNKKALFYIEAEGDKLAKTISAETGAELYTLNPFENGAENKDYFTVMNENLENLKDALGKDE